MRALVLGGASWNTMVYLDSFPEPRPQTVFAHGMYETVGSSGAGKAMNLRRLGADVTLWALVGDDDAGARVRAVMAARGIRLLTQTDPEGTMRHVNLMDAAGERISIFGISGSADFLVDTTMVREAAATADLVSVTIFDHCRRFLPMLRAMGRPVWIDIHDYDGMNPYHDDFIAAADFLQMSSTQMEDWRSFLERRVAAGTQVALCTHGARGSSALTAADGWIDVPAVPVDIVDTNGAGDGFFAGFAATFLGGASLAGSLARGAHTAAAALRSRDLAPD